MAGWLAIGLMAGCSSQRVANPSADRGAAEPSDTVVSQPVDEPSRVEAQIEEAPPAGGYAWDDLARRAAARCNEANVLFLEAAVERHQAAYDTRWRNPQLRADSQWGDQQSSTPGRALRERDEWGNRESAAHGTGLRVYFNNPFVNRWVRRRGAAAADAVEAASREAAYAVFVEVRGLCLEADMLRLEIDLLRQQADVQDELIAVRRAQAEVGLYSALRLVRLEARRATLFASIQTRIAARQQLLRRIAVFAGLPLAGLEIKPLDLERALPDPDQDAAVLAELALLRRPDLWRARAEREAAEAAVSAARAERIPWIEYGEGSYEDGRTRGESREQGTPGVERTTRDESEWQISMALTLPVFNWIGDDLRLTRAQLAAAAAREHGVDAAIREEVAAVLEDYRQARAIRDPFIMARDALQREFTAQIDQQAREHAVRLEEALEAREALIEHALECLEAEGDTLRLAQELEAVSGGPLALEGP